MTERKIRAYLGRFWDWLCRRTPQKLILKTLNRQEYRRPVLFYRGALKIAESLGLTIVYDTLQTFPQAPGEPKTGETQYKVLCCLLDHNKSEVVKFVASVSPLEPYCKKFREALEHRALIDREKSTITIDSQENIDDLVKAHAIQLAQRRALIIAIELLMKLRTPKTDEAFTTILSV
jgi:hypothetical protein